MHPLQPGVQALFGAAMQAEHPEAEFQALQGGVGGIELAGLADEIEGGFELAEMFVGEAEVVEGHDALGIARESGVATGDSFLVVATGELGDGEIQPAADQIGPNADQPFEARQGRAAVAGVEQEIGEFQ